MTNKRRGEVCIEVVKILYGDHFIPLTDEMIRKLDAAGVSLAEVRQVFRDVSERLCEEAGIGTAADAKAMAVSIASSPHFAARA